MRRAATPLLCVGTSFVLLLAGCATRELTLQDAEAPWAAEGAATVALGTFQAEPAAWAIADKARSGLREALARGTVRVVDRDAALVLVGAVSHFLEQTTPGAPRRILRTTGSSGALPPGPFNETYAWEMDVEQAVQIRLVVRLQRPDGHVVWTREAAGQAVETQAVLVNWPGHDPMPPPATLPHAPDPVVFGRLRERALKEALEPLLAAVTVRYTYHEMK